MDVEVASPPSELSARAAADEGRRAKSSGTAGSGLVPRVLPWLIPVVVLVAWQVLGSNRVISSSFLPTPVEVVQAAIRLLERGDLQSHVWVSMRRALWGFAIGGGVGFFLGVLNGVSRISAGLFDTSIQMLRTIPHLALIPLVILWFGIGEEAKIFLVALGVAFPIYLNTYNGIKNIDAGLLEMGRVYRIGRKKMFTEIVIPGAMPSILVGVRYSLGVMWTTLIVAETIGADAGIGYMATSAREFVQMDVVVLSIVIYALLGKVSDMIAVALERRLLRWNPVFAKPGRARRRGQGAA
jgi:sulfonate transport system permease protein